MVDYVYAVSWVLLQDNRGKEYEREESGRWGENKEIDDR